MAYQSAEVLFDRCEWVGHILVRLPGTCARARQGGRTGDMTQRATVGYLPFRARPTHVAAPPRYIAGEFSGHKARGIQTRRDHGSWAGRLSAAAVYARDNGCLPPAWDRAAQSPALESPALLDGYFGTERPGNAALPAQSPQDISEGASESARLLSGAVPLDPEGTPNRRRHPPTQRSSPDNASAPTPRPTQPSVSRPAVDIAENHPRRPRAR